jgi:hypothetical protein
MFKHGVSVLYGGKGGLYAMHTSQNSEPSFLFFRSCYGCFHVDYRVPGLENLGRRLRILQEEKAVRSYALRSPAQAVDSAAALRP